MSVRTLIAPSSTAAITTAAPESWLGSPGSWTWEFLTIDWLFQLKPEFFDADVKFFGSKVATFDLSVEDPQAKLDFNVDGWDVVGTISIEIPVKEVVANLTVTNKNVIKLQRKFVLFTWATRE